MEERNLIQDSVTPMTRREIREAALAGSQPILGSDPTPEAAAAPAAPALTMTRAMLRELHQQSVQLEPVQPEPVRAKQVQSKPAVVAPPVLAPVIAPTVPFSVFDKVPTPELDLSEPSQHMCESHAAEEAAYSHRSTGTPDLPALPTRSSLRSLAVAAHVSADPVVAVPVVRPEPCAKVEAALKPFAPVTPLPAQPTVPAEEVAIPPATRRAARQGSKSPGDSAELPQSLAFSNSVLFPNSATSPAVHVWAPVPFSIDGPATCSESPDRLTTSSHFAATRTTATRRGGQRPFARKADGISGGKLASRVAILASLAIATVTAPMALANTPEPEPLAEESAAPKPLVGPSTAEVVAGAPMADVAPIGISQLTPLDDRVVQVASRSDERTALSGCNGAQAAPGANGLLSQLDLCAVAQGHTLRADAAVAFAALNEAYTDHFGQSICLVGSYRTLATQHSLKIEKGSLAATPGTSNHGWGLAVDICNTSYHAANKWSWLNENAPRFGWAQPSWASRSYEPWHWEFTAGVEAK